MVQSDARTEEDIDLPFSYLGAPEHDEIFEESIDTFDEEMDQDYYDDGILQSDIDHLEDESEEDDLGDDEDNISPFDYNDEFADYDELEE